MSHIVTVKLEIKNEEIFKRACEKMGFKTTFKHAPNHDLERTFITLEGKHRRHPFHLVLQDGGLRFDGDYQQSIVDPIMQRYAADIVIEEATANGQQISETVSEDGTIQLEILEV